MKHWPEFQPRSLCSFGSDGDGDGGPGDSSGGFDSSGFDSGFTGGPESSDVSNADFFGTDFTGPESSNISNADFFGTDFTGPDSFTGPESSNVSNADFFGDNGPTGGGFTGGGFDYSGSPYADFGPGPGFGMDPTGGVDFTGGGMGFGYGPGPAGNMGIGNAIGPPGAMTGDFGLQGYGGPTSTGAGPGSTTSIGGPGAYAAAPGINGFPGDFGAPAGGALGMPNSQDVGPQAGPGMPGGPSAVQQGEALNPSLFGPEVTAPDRVAPDDRTQADPTTVFGPEFAQQSPGIMNTVAGWFGPSEAQAGQNMTNQGVIDAAMLANDFGRTGSDMTAYMAATNPGLAQALSQIATNYNADPANDPANYAGPSPGAQQGFTGTTAQQGTMAFDSFGGKGDRGSTQETAQTNPNFDLVGPMVTQQGYQQLAAEMNAQQQQAPVAQTRGIDPETAQQGYATLAAQMNAQNQQQDMMTAQELGEQGRGPGLDSRGLDPGTIQAGRDMLTQAMLEAQQTPEQNQQQAQMFDLQSRGEQDKGPTVAPFDSRFGSLPSNEQQQVQAQQLSTDFGPNYGPQTAQNQQTIGPQLTDLLSNLNPATPGVGRDAAPLGLLGMMNEPASRGSPAGNPYQAGSQFGVPFGRGSESSNPFSSRGSNNPGLSITVGGRGSPGSQQAAGRGSPGYYSTGGAGIAPGAKGAEFGGIYGPGQPTGLPGTNAFGIDSRSGGIGYVIGPDGTIYGTRR